MEVPDMTSLPQSRRTGGPHPPFWLKSFENPGLVVGGQWYRSGPMRLTVCFSIDDGSLHMSISHPERYPTWDEIVIVWQWKAGPDIEGVIVVPRANQYVNLHRNCFHVWQSRCGEEGGPR
jgi:hypothetical protein